MLLAPLEKMYISRLPGELLVFDFILGAMHMGFEVKRQLPKY